jgi:hypothetical protein
VELEYSISLGQGSLVLGSSLSDLLSPPPARRYLLGFLMLRARREVSKNAQFLVPRHENVVLRHQIGRVRYQPTGRLWLTARPG